MVFKGCPRCGGDLWVEEDISSHMEELVCIQCGRPQAVGPNAEEYAKTTRWLTSQRPSSIAA
jgi:hypothetical protein